MECVDNIGRDTATGRHIVPVSTSPLPDCSTLLAIDGAAAATGAGASTPPTTDTTAGFHPLLQVVAQFRGVLARKVNLIGHSIEPEFDRFIGSAFTVEIIDQGDGHFFRHLLTPCFLPVHLLCKLLKPPRGINLP
jgi:hypothetical protein